MTFIEILVLAVLLALIIHPAGEITHLKKRVKTLEEDRERDSLE